MALELHLTVLACLKSHEHENQQQDRFGERAVARLRCKGKLLRVIRTSGCDERSSGISLQLVKMLLTSDASRMPMTLIMVSEMTTPVMPNARHHPELALARSSP